MSKIITNCCLATPQSLGFLLGYTKFVLDAICYVCFVPRVEKCIGVGVN